MNSVTLTGRLTADPVVRIVGEEGNLLAKYRLAVDRPKSKDREDKADFFNCVVFGNKAAAAEQYLQKGDRLLVQGNLRSGSYKNKKGDTVYTTDVYVINQEFIEYKKDRSENKNPEKEDAAGLPGDEQEEGADGFFPEDFYQEELPF